MQYIDSSGQFLTGQFYHFTAFCQYLIVLFLSLLYYQILII